MNYSTEVTLTPTANIKWLIWTDRNTGIEYIYDPYRLLAASADDEETK